jgi:rare lipoprotein A (peptidoglycan hydrolase)
MRIKLIGLLAAGLLNISVSNFDQTYNQVGYMQEGVASYYADQFHGRRTANGERFDMHELTCAHPRIRFNTELKVTNLINGKSVVVRVNDRGPYVDNRVIDLSLAAAKKLDMVRSGTTRVRCEVVAVEDMPVAVKERMERERRERQGDEQPKEETSKKKPTLLEKIGGVFGKKKKTEPTRPEPEVDRPKPQTKPEPKPKETKKEPVVVEKKEPLPKEVEAEPKPVPGGGQVDMPQRVRKRPLTEDTFAGINTYSIWGTIKYPEGFGVQVASYAVLDKALEKGREITDQGFKDVYLQTGWAGDKRIYRLVVGEGTTAAATALASDLRAKGFSGFVKQHY